MFQVSKLIVVASAAFALQCGLAAAQGTAVPVLEAPPSGTMTNTSAAGAAKARAPRECTRLPLSDIQVGKDKTIEVARVRLDEYITEVGAKRGWKSWDKSQETVACEDYLYLPLVGQEYKCLVTATFCKKS